MPQVDLETLVSACAGGVSMDNRKVACETQASAAVTAVEIPGDDDDDRFLPPDSYWLSKDDEYDWFDRNAFLDRRDSTKGGGNTNSNSTNNSQRFSMNLKYKAAILGLPKPQKTTYAVGDAKHRRNCKVKMFPKRSGSIGKSTDGSTFEPSSPKVSCMGRVRSKRDRKRRWRNRHLRSKSVSMNNDTSLSNTSINDASVKSGVERESGRRGKSGFLASFRGLFRHGRRKSSKSGDHAPFGEEEEETPRRSSVAARRGGGAFDYETASCDSFPRASTESEPPGLGGMKRFVSGRRSGSWAGEQAIIDVA